MVAATLTAADWWGLFVHFLVLSLLAIGGAIATVPDMHRYLVGEKGWMSDEVFASSVALAQAAPGPNLLFVPVLGFQVAGVPGALVTLVGMLLPSTTLALTATRWMESRRDAIGVRAFVMGLMPVTLGLLLATGWVLAQALRGDLALIALVAVAGIASWRTKIAPVWMVAAGAALGAIGVV
jgi:chromate transporter